MIRSRTEFDEEYTKALEIIDQQRKELATEKARADGLKKELLGKQDELYAWQLAFGSSQLTHALGAFEAASARADALDTRAALKTAALNDCVDALNQERSARLKAESAVAEMRDCFIKNPRVECGCPHCVKIEHALSSDCGTGWLSPEVAEKVREFVELVPHRFPKCSRYLPGDKCVCGKNEALALLDKEGAR